MTPRYAPPRSGAWRTVTVTDLHVPVRVRLRVVPDAVAPDRWTEFARAVDEGLPGVLAELVDRVTSEGAPVPCVLEPGGEVVVDGALEIGRVGLGDGGPLVPWTFGRFHLSLRPHELAMAEAPEEPPPPPPRAPRPTLGGDETADVAADDGFPRTRRARARPPASGPRLLQCRVGPPERDAEPDNVLRRGRNAVFVFLGPEERDALVGGAVGDDALGFDEADGDVVEVRVQLIPFEPIGTSSAGKLFVPRSGRSNTARLVWEVPDGVQSARAQLVVTRGRRTICLADLTGTVGRKARLTSVFVVADPRETKTVDRSLVADTDAAGTPAVVVPGREVELLPQLGVLAENCRKALNRATTLAAEGTPRERLEEAREVLVAVAQAGADLLIELEPLLGDLTDATSLQVITSQAPSALPIEVLYTRPAPLPDAKVCPTWLAGGTCGPDCGGDAPESVVCPAGFWGVSRTVERHHHDRTGDRALLDVALPDADRPQLPLGPLVLAAASLVTEQMLADAGFAAGDRITAWDAWGRRVVAADGLVVLMPHTEPSPARLEISGRFLHRSNLQGYLTRGKKAGRRPTVVLFGCDTGGRADDPVGYTGRFLRTGAAIVFASLSLLLADEAPFLASRLVGALRDPARAGQSVGRVLTDVRADAVRAGFVSALALTSYGSTDWEV